MWIDSFYLSVRKGYKTAPAKTIDEYAKLDEQDESLARWKASLGIVPGAAAAAKGPKVRLSRAGTPQATNVLSGGRPGRNPHPRTAVSDATAGQEAGDRLARYAEPFTLEDEPGEHQGRHRIQVSICCAAVFDVWTCYPHTRARVPLPSPRQRLHHVLGQRHHRQREFPNTVSPSCIPF